MGKSKKIVILVIVGIIASFVIANVTYHQVYSVYYPDEYAKQMEEIEQRKAIETQQRIEERKQEAELTRQEELKQQEALRIAQLKELPTSCYGVNSIETYLYPTGKACIKAIDDRINEYCLSETNENKAQADACVVKVYSLMDRNCQGSDDQGFLSVSYEVCMMSELRFAYQNLIPK